MKSVSILYTSLYDPYDNMKYCKVSKSECESNNIPLWEEFKEWFGHPFSLFWDNEVSSLNSLHFCRNFLRFFCCFRKLSRSLAFFCFYFRFCCYFHTSLLLKTKKIPKYTLFLIKKQKNLIFSRLFSLHFDYSILCIIFLVLESSIFKNVPLASEVHNHWLVSPTPWSLQEYLLADFLEYLPKVGCFLNYLANLRYRMVRDQVL